MKQKLSFTIISKNIKYLGINMRKDVKNPYTENYKISLREVKKTYINEEIDRVHELEGSVLLRC